MTFRIVILFILSVFFGCSDDNDNPGQSSSNANYLTQPLQGNINGVFWQASDGILNSNLFNLNPATTSIHSFSVSDSLIELLDSSSCLISGLPGASLTVNIYGGNIIPQVGVEKVVKAPTSADGSINHAFVAVSPPGGDDPIFLTNGGVQVISVDTINREAEFRIHAWADKPNNEVNGYFTAYYCYY